MRPERLVETLAYLICQQGIQVLLLLVVICDSYDKSVGTYWDSRQLTPGLFNAVFVGHANQDVAAAVVCVFLAAMTMMADDRDKIASIYPCETSRLSIRTVAVVLVDPCYPHPTVNQHGCL